MDNTVVGPFGEDITSKSRERFENVQYKDSK